MQGKLIAGVGVLAVCVVAACCLVPSLGNASDARRGGNHGCNAAEGTAFSDNWWKAGDSISWGLAFEPGSPLPPGSDDQHVLKAENTSAAGGQTSSVSCGDDVGGWLSVSSDLGPGDDAVRFDAKGLEDEKGQGPYNRLPKTVDTTVKGGSGSDTIRGHKGFDSIRAGSGRDMIKAYDGVKDNVNCGTGRDKAVVDTKDEVTNCERLIVQVDPS